MREDLHTPNVEAAAAWQAHHDPGPAPDEGWVGDSPDPGPPPCGGCRRRDCLTCGLEVAIAKLRRIGGERP